MQNTSGKSNRDSLFKNMWQEAQSYNLDSIKISWASNVKENAASSRNRK